jgi:hypothetical protein
VPLPCCVALCPQQPGHLRYSKHADDAPGVDKWQFFQPFCGGTAFVTTQAISWSIFAAALVSLVVLLQQVVAGVAHCFRYWALGAGTFMVMAQAVSVRAGRAAMGVS